MAMPPRIEFPGAFYHINVRGNQKQAIFIDDQDRIQYLERLKRYKTEHGFILYAYTLMFQGSEPDVAEVHIAPWEILLTTSRCTCFSSHSGCKERMQLYICTLAECHNPKAILSLSVGVFLLYTSAITLSITSI
jgi:hypothetical protein